ncbi:MAG: hypothetical protein IH621_06615 [Krumholzibacteria bacterium]|nr:hypothetical protein [Candidatus Krumholzibacteria bacterium]
MHSLVRSLALPVAVLLFAPAAPASAGLPDLQNAIGLYTDLPRDLDEAADLAAYEGDPGTFPVYAVLINPWNEHTNSRIDRLGGFEFRLELPSNVFLLDAALPAACINFMSPPNFFVGADIPVSGDAAALMTLTLGEFSGTGGRVLLAPVSTTPSIPGSMAVADYEDEFSISVAVPSSGSFASPVFCVFCRQYDEEATWGGVKTLYR